MKVARWLFVSALLLFPAASPAFMVAPAVSIDDLANQADVIFEGTAVSTTATQDPAFEGMPGVIVSETVFRPAYAIKGKIVSGEMKFRHYEPDPKLFMSGVYWPQNYSIQTGKSYLVFAKQPPGDDANTCQQIWMRFTCMEDEGVLLGMRPYAAGHNTMKEEFWRNLTELLQSPDPKDVVYAIKHLDELSATSDAMRSFGVLSEFEHLNVLAAIHGLITHSDPTVAQAALIAVGSHNPYMDRVWAPFWLASVGSADSVGFGKVDPKMVNSGGMIYWREIAAVVDSQANDATRALAVTALGLVREPSLKDSVVRWLGDPIAAVRSSAVLLMVDYPTLATHDRFAALATDADVETRISTAYAIGYGQFIDDADVLTKLLTDSDSKVRQAASMSLLSFSPKDKRIAKIFQDNQTNKEFGVLFLVAICKENPANLDLLIQETTDKTDPTNWQGGQVPAYTTSHLLFDYLKAKPATDLQSGKYDRALDALEIWKPNYSVDPQFVYALELKDGLTDRAKKFRAAANKASTYDLEIYFKRADQNPDMYLY
jgi:hypothetical protein